MHLTTLIYKPRWFLALLLALGARLLMQPVTTWACGEGIICVDVDASSSTPDGQTWATAYPSLHTALAVAGSGDEIWVAGGVYTATSPFDLKSGVEVYGGFAATETLRTQRDWLAHQTVLSGDLGQDDVVTGTLYTASWADQRGTNAHHVVRASFVDATARLDGFIVTAGSATTSSGGGGILNVNSNAGYYNLEVRGNQGASLGGGMLNMSSSSHVANVLFDGNRTTSSIGRGGGVFNLYGGSPVIKHVVFNNNLAGMGGGYGSDGGTPYLEDVTFSSNRATDYGGGAYSYAGANVMLEGVTFVNNQAYMGGGIYARDYGSLTMTNTTFIQNTALASEVSNFGGGLAAEYSMVIDALNVSFIGNMADGNGGGLFVGPNSTLNLRNGLFLGNRTERLGGGLGTSQNTRATLTNVTFHGNQAGRSASNVAWGGALAAIPGFGGEITVTNSILWGNAPNEVYGETININDSNVQRSTGVYPGTGNINSDPFFVMPIDATHAPTTTGDVHLLPNSPAIDAGNPESCPVVDLRGLPRIDLRCDIGAFELQYTDSDTVIKQGFSEGVPYSFGPTWISMTLGVADAGLVTVTKQLTYPGGTQDPGEIPVTWWISSSLSTGWPLTLSLCYTDEEVAGLDESALCAFRWDGVGWTRPISTGLRVDEAANCVTLTGIEEFSGWTLIDVSGIPTAVTVHSLVARSWATGLLLMSGAGVLFASGLRRRRSREARGIT